MALKKAEDTALRYLHLSPCPFLASANYLSLCAHVRSGCSNEILLICFYDTYNTSPRCTCFFLTTKSVPFARSSHLEGWKRQWKTRLDESNQNPASKLRAWNPQCSTQGSKIRKENIWLQRFSDFRGCPSFSQFFVQCHSLFQSSLRFWIWSF